MTTMDEQQEAKRRKLEALEAKMGGAPPPQATRPAKMPELPALKPTQPTPAEAAPPTTDASEEEARSPFVCDANDVVQFRLVRTEADMDAAEVFEPEFTHQIFRDDETIFGYRDLVVKISMSANLFKTLVEISYAEKVKSVLNPADDITAMLKRHLGDDVFTDRAAFIATLKADASAPVPSAGGTIVSTWETVGDDGVTYVDTARVFRLSDDDVYPWHARFEPMILFYIDGASAIDSEDTKWLLFAVTRARADDASVWSLTSFATVYEFFVYPGATRARLSQIVVLPPYQRKGLGGKMLESVRAYSKIKEFADVTVEDPTPQLQRLRDASDVRAMWASYCKQRGGSPEKPPPLDLLVCNAGVLLNELTLTSERVETTFACHLLFGTYLLGELAMPALEASADARVVVVSSGGMYNTKFPAWEVATALTGEYDGNLAYAYAKRGQVLLCERWAEEHPKVKFVSCHPGWTATLTLTLTLIPNLTPTPTLILTLTLRRP